ncbi:hypothetical protein EI77_01837 [Prosthecobacter fusiformis]|uniref:LURP-one-related protein n=1 Tax=Prosthecobacter fusiformis TaxID=48464 RepID=A0A4R7S7Y1_9BACT|nr:hypothetical protein [Prosthecobacter fusiformis]TDU73367.1 hypothetical protein EI77_01837 [Prosthecobacter fusiformis]
MNYPLTFRFKLIALTPQIYVEDAAGNQVCYVKQKMFRFREKVEVYTNDTRTQLLATIEADRILDWSARYTFRDARGNEIGAVGRRGMKSLWRAHYEVFAPGSKEIAFLIREENPGAKLMDGFIGEIPVVGMFSGFMFHPRYLASRPDTTPVLRLTKQSALFEGRFELVQVNAADEGEQTALMLSFLMMNLLERKRG